MTAFQKPQAQKAALKMALYGPAGSGKTFTSLLLAEGLALHTNKRIAYIDTENGTAFYAQDVPQRSVHPHAFDFDVLYTKSITEVLAALRGLDERTHGIVVIDSISHLWDACKNAFTGRLTRAGTIPLNAWTAIKKPYKELLHLLLASPVHVLICGRQGNDFAEEDASGELKNNGYKMRAEGETAYEPDVLIRLEATSQVRRPWPFPSLMSRRTAPASWQGRASSGRRSRMWRSRCWDCLAARKQHCRRTTRSVSRMPLPWGVKNWSGKQTRWSWRPSTQPASRRPTASALWSAWEKN